MTKKMKRWHVSRGWLDASKEEAIAVYKNEVASKGWLPDGIIDTFDNKQEAEAFFETQLKTLGADGPKGCSEIALLTEESYEIDVELEGECGNEYKDLEIAVGE